MKWKTALTVTTLTLAPTAFSGTNLSDAIDANEVPRNLEQREEEIVNQPDTIDRNETPSMMEGRTTKEKWREDYSEIQDDMRKTDKK